MASVIRSVLLPKVSADASRAWRRLANGLRYLAGEKLGEVAATPRTAVWEHHNVSLYKYPATVEAGLPPVLLVHSLVSLPYVFDLQPGSSLVEDLSAAGYDVYLLDWGVPRAVDAGNMLETYCDDYIPAAVDEVLRDSGSKDLDVIGYCLGAVLAALAIAGHEDLPVHSLAMLAPPIDFTKMHVTENLLGGGRVDPASLLDETGNVPPSTLVAGFRMLAPTTDLKTAANLWHGLQDQAQLHALTNLLSWSSTHIPFPGAAFQQMIELFLRQRVLTAGVVPLNGRDVRLADIGTRGLVVTGERDFMVPPEATAPIDAAFAPARLDHLQLPAGHAGLFVGRSARKHCVPSIIAWLEEK
jgi:polyhydroxyalkanoate synthase subunit PhaC